MPKVNPRISSIDALLGLGETGAPVQSVAVKADSASATSNNGIVNLPPSKIRYFRKHPFRLYTGERLDDLAESIRAHGILMPTIVRHIEPDENGYEYEMLAGHNRHNGATIAGLPTIPCIVKENLSDADAWVYVIETNVLQRSFKEMLPSEKAAVLALHYSDMFSQGKRNDIITELKKLQNPLGTETSETCGTECHKLKNRDRLGEEYELKGRSVANYLRIDKLTDALKERVDNAEFRIIDGVGLSYLTEQEQDMVDGILSDNDFKFSDKKVAALRAASGKLTNEKIIDILSGAKLKMPTSKKPAPLKVKPAIYTKYFSPDTKQSDMEQIIDKALALYFEQNGDVAS